MSNRIKLNQRGLSLVELMIVVTIIGILMTITYPSYLSYMQDTRRGVAEADLMELSQWMERNYTVSGRYTNVSNAAPALPFDKSPKDGAVGHYGLGIIAITANSYVLTATPVPGSAQSTDPCGVIRVDQTGNRVFVGGC